MSRHPSRFAPGDPIIGVRFPDHEIKAHSYDFNDQAAILEHRQRQASDVFLRDGAVVSGGGLAIDRASGLASAAAAQVYARGLFLQLLWP